MLDDIPNFGINTHFPLFYWLEGSCQKSCSSFPHVHCRSTHEVLAHPALMYFDPCVMLQGCEMQRSMLLMLATIPNTITNTFVVIGEGRERLGGGTSEISNLQ